MSVEPLQVNPSEILPPGKWKSSVGNMLWSLMGPQIDALSQDAPGYKSMNEGPSWLVLTGIPIPLYNMAFIDQKADSGGELLMRWIEQLRSTGVPASIFLNNPLSIRYQQVINQLRPTSVETVSHMVATPKTPFPISGNHRLVIVHEPNNLFEQIINHQAVDLIGEPQDRDAIRSTMDRVMLQNPHVTTFALVDGNSPDSLVLSSCMFVDSDKVTTGLWNMVTPHEMQGQGLGTELLGKAMNYQLENGRRLFQLIPSGDRAEQFYAHRFGYRTFTTSTCVNI